MDGRQAERLSTIQAFEMDDAAARLGFARRLAKENAWSDEFARRAIREYKRFMLLAADAGHPVSPPDAVDQVWHLHLIYTRSYWERFTPLLGKRVHHDPTKGGPSETAKFTDWYAKTIESYRRLIGEEPPSDIWPTVAQRFEEDVARVDRRRNWIVPKRAVGRGAMAAGTFGAVAAVAGCAATLGSASSNVGVTIAVIVGAIILVVGVMMMLVRAFTRSSGTNSFRSTKSSNQNSSHGTGCSAAPMFLYGAGASDGASHQPLTEPKEPSANEPANSQGANSSEGGPTDTGSSSDGAPSGCSSGGDSGGSGCGGGGCGGGGGGD